MKQSIKADVKTLDVILHQEALQTLINFAYQMMDSFVVTEELDTASSRQIAVQPESKKDDKKQGNVK